MRSKMLDLYDCCSPDMNEYLFKNFHPDEVDELLNLQMNVFIQSYERATGRRPTDDLIQLYAEIDLVPDVVYECMEEELSFKNIWLFKLIGSVL